MQVACLEPHACPFPPYGVRLPLAHNSPRAELGVGALSWGPELCEWIFPGVMSTESIGGVGDGGCST